MNGFEERRRVRIGARFPNAGDVPRRLGLAEAARRLEVAGFDSLWTSDHLAMPSNTESGYPFSDDGRFPWPPDLGWSEAVVSLALAASVTDRIELGTAVLVAPLRHPLVAGMQAASIAVQAPGRVTLGVGSGWLEDEFHAVGVPYSKRGPMLDGWIDVVRSVWSGSLPVRPDDSPYPNPSELICRPTPPSPIPVLIGGMSARALQRVGRSGDGWVALQPVGGLDAGALAGAIQSIREHARDAGRADAAMRVVLQITGSAGRATEIAGRLPALAEAGVHDVIVDVDWDTDGFADDVRVLSGSAVGGQT